MNRLRVHVTPTAAWSARSRLFRALEEAFPVRFEGTDGPRGELPDAQISLSRPENLRGAPPRVPTLCLGGASLQTPVPGSGMVRFAAHRALPACLHRTSLREETWGCAPPVPLAPGDTVLAASEVPVWAVREGEGAASFASSVVPTELSDREGLRDRLREGRFLELLPLVHFLGDLARSAGWEEPGLRAAFMVDDPNLHGPSYGYLHFGHVARHAREHRYHLTIAMVPIDTWFTHASAARIFRDHPGQLSILIHGNNHVREELLRSASREQARQMLAQALRRIDRFERRTGLRVSRIMSAPHSVCSELMVEEMLRLGFEGLSLHRPYPWTDTPDVDPGLVDWWPAELAGPGLPILHRQPWGWPRDRLLFRALLHHPLVLYGHHDDLDRGLEPLAEQAERMNRWGDVRWMSLEEMARTNFARRVEGRSLRLRLYSRRIRAAVPEGVDEAILEMPLRSDPASGAESATVAGERGTFRAVAGSLCREAGPFPVTPGRDVEIRVDPPHLEDPFSVPPPSFNAWPMLRRFLTEGRDRLRPVWPGRSRSSG